MNMHICWGYPGYFQDPPWKLLGLLEISRLTLTGMYMLKLYDMTTCCLLNTSHKICNVKNFIVFVLILCFDSYWIHLIYSSIFFRVASLALGQSYYCPSASEATLKSKGHHNHTQKTMNHMHISWGVFYAVNGSFRALFSYCYIIIVYNDTVGCTMFHLFSYPSVKSWLLILCTVMPVFIFFPLKQLRGILSLNYAQNFLAKFLNKLNIFINVTTCIYSAIQQQEFLSLASSIFRVNIKLHLPMLATK